MQRCKKVVFSKLLTSVQLQNKINYDCNFSVDEAGKIQQTYKVHNPLLNVLKENRKKLKMKNKYGIFE